MKALFRLLIITIIVLLCMQFNSDAQIKKHKYSHRFDISAIKDSPKQKWQETGVGFHKDTTSVTFQLIGKDSTSYERKTENCKCAVFRTKSGLMPCDSLLKEHYVITSWVWEYTKYLFNGNVIRFEKPDWRQSFSWGSTIDYQYYYNGKLVYPIEFYRQPIQH